MLVIISDETVGLNARLGEARLAMQPTAEHQQQRCKARQYVVATTAATAAATTTHCKL